MDVLPNLLLVAWLAPLVSFVIIVFAGPKLGKHGVLAGYVATFAIVLGFVLSMTALVIWRQNNPYHPTPHSEAADAHSSHVEHADKTYVAGEWYQLSPPGMKQKISVGYYIDALTIGMFVVVTLIASCIHFYSMGYMHEELHEVTDHEVTMADGHHLHRPGRYYRFFQYMSLFCFSMLGLVIAGNIAMVFVFWELVGICSYFLIGFYIERKSACNAANKAFIVNRIGDFGMIVGLMALWGSLGTFAFGDKQTTNDKGELVVARNAKGEIVEPGLFSLVRPAQGHRGTHAAADAHAKTPDHQLVTPDGMVLQDAGAEVASIEHDHAQMYERPQDSAAATAAEVASRLPTWREQGYGYWLLIVAGIGIFCGCVGKSAQFPLHVWLPDAMEGPTPVSALVHSATMVAAGVYLVGRFYPVFTPEVLLVIASVGAITLFIAATIAITAVDIKRVLAYSTVSQLGYMMLALGVGGWIAGVFHLITHAFFKSLLFLCSGSVIHACHTNDMRKMGGLLKKMPYTGYTMLVGCLAIIGAGAPGAGVGLSGYYSKDSILAQALNFGEYNPSLRFFFPLAAGGAAITAFYMFRMWFMTFVGKPRDHHVHEHVHEAPPVMYVPLLILAFFAVAAGWNWLTGISTLLDQAVPDGVAEGATSSFWMALHYPAEHLSHGVHGMAEAVAFGTAIFGVSLAALLYWFGLLNPADVRAFFSPIYRLLWNKWYFDEIYWTLFVRPTMFLSRIVARIDRSGIDWLIDNSAKATVRIARLDDQIIDRTFVDGLVNLMASWIFSLGIYLRRFQTGRLRQYVTFIVVGTVALFVLIGFWSKG